MQIIPINTPPIIYDSFSLPWPEIAKTLGKMVDRSWDNTYNHCPAHHPVLAAIDLGTNSCRLLVASVNIATLGRTFFNARPHLLGWRVVDSFARIVRLGEGIQQEELLSPLAIQRTLEALAICREKMDANRVSFSRAVATEACRRARNSADLVDKAYALLDIDLDVISSQEEARLALTGCAGVLKYNIPYAILFDIGGGSTEIIWVQIDYQARRRPGYPVPFRVLDSISLPLGVVVSTESLELAGNGHLAYDDIRSNVFEAVNKFAIRNGIGEAIAHRKVQLVGSSGTVTTLAAILIRLRRYERHLVDGLLLQTNELRRVVRDVACNTGPLGYLHPCVGRGRSDLIVTGSAILEGILDVFPLSDLRVADRGVREGILSELLDKLVPDSLEMHMIDRLYDDVGS